MNTTQSMKPLEIKTEYGPPPSQVRWTPYELNKKYPILNTKQWTFAGTRYIAKPTSPRNLLKSDPWFRPLRKWCKDDKVWGNYEGHGPHDWISNVNKEFYRYNTVEGKHIMLWCE